jgi:hypothetical protein
MIDLKNNIYSSNVLYILIIWSLSSLLSLLISISINMLSNSASASVHFDGVHLVGGNNITAVIVGTDNVTGTSSDSSPIIGTDNVTGSPDDSIIDLPSDNNITAVIVGTDNVTGSPPPDDS